ncbi:MAG: insulinase family protein [Acidobacteria bacterium]|jgi:predicted Zn-dependent peptidase|nr:insulinase family protein [Acidobacteriota bacterium]
MNKKSVAIFTFAAVLLALFAAPLAAQKNPKDKFDFPKLNPLKIPPVKQLTLKNGIRLFLVEDHRFPTIDMQGLFFASSAFEPAAKTGLAALAGTVLRTGGTKTMPGDQIDRELETMAAAIETSITSENGSISVSMLKENLDRVLPIMAAILRQPLFDQEKIDLAKIQVRSGISRRNDDIGQITNREFEKLIYGAQSPYARQAEYATIDAIGRDDIVAFYKGYFHPDNMWLAVWGDFDSKQMIRKIESALGDWPAAGLKLPALPEVRYEYKSTVNYIEKTDVNQSNIMVGHIGGLLDSPDYAALSVMNRILSFDRMFKRIRTDEGLAYSVWGVYDAGFKVPGVFSAGAQTKSGSTLKAIGIMLDEMKRMRREEVSDEEIRRAKDQFLNSYVFQFDSRAKIIRRMLTYAYYGYPLDFSEQVFKKIETVTKADILNAAAKHLRPDQVQILVVGKKEDFDKPLAELGPVNAIDIAIPVPAGEKGPAATAETLAKGGEFFAKAIAAMGEPQKVKAIRSVRLEGDMIQSTPMGEMTMAAEIVSVYPDKVCFILNTPGGKMNMVINGAKGVVKMPQGAMPLPEAEMKNILDNIRRDAAYVWQNRDQYQVQFLGRRPFAGKEAIDLDVSGLGLSFHLFLDPQTMLPTGTSYQTVTREGPTTIEEIFSDYREVEGIKMPFKTESFAKEKKVSSQVVKIMQLNAAVSDDLFKTE